MVRLIFVGSLPNNKNHFDGERNKTRDVLKAIKILNKYIISVVDYTKNPFLQSFKLIFLSVIYPKAVFFISKSPNGGLTAISIIKSIQRNPNIIFYLIGNGLKQFNASDSKISNLQFVSKLIVESDLVHKQVNEYYKFEKYVFPVVKNIPTIELLEKPINQETLHCIYFSRISLNKGPLDAIEGVIKANSELKKVAFTIDLAGGSNVFSGRETKQRILDYQNKHPEIVRFLDTKLSIENDDSYRILQKYDLHLFPSYFKGECAPGSVVDMFIAGVPTLSSRFDSALYLMSDQNSYFFEPRNTDDLSNKLVYIYNNQAELVEKRRVSNIESRKYSIEAFSNYLVSNHIL